MSQPYDCAVIGGGIMGAATAIRLAEGGMKVLLCEAQQLGMGASGVNAGTLSLQIKRVALMPYALKGHAIWAKAGDAVGFKECGGITLAFTDHEAEILTDRMGARIKAGAPIEMISCARARELEPHLTERIVSASYCHADGYANSSLTGAYYRGKLAAAGVHVMEFTSVDEIFPDESGITVKCASGTYRARSALLATGAWTKEISARLGVSLPIRVRINTVSVTERMPKLAKKVIGHATGLLTLKQSTNGTVLIGGGWQGTGTPEAGRGHVMSETLTSNLRLAQYAIPELADARIVRCWTGFEANSPDFFPMAGRMPGWHNLFVLCCVRGGYTIGPYIGRLMGDYILGHELELPLFDPIRFVQTHDPVAHPTR
jgi:glycine/D-amino acid oxidase-like deaminating enzyme